MAGLHKSEFSNPVINWIDTRLPIFTMMQKEYGVFPTPKNFNYFWNFGALAMVTLVIMIATGIFLAMNYQPNSELAFDSVQHIMRDVNYGWLLRYVHQNGASMFFIVTYIHIFRGMYYGSYKSPRELLWMIGVVILLLMMATAFMGYVLPWGQMSYWGATVITNLFSAFPIVGKSIVTLLWGGFSVDNPTLNRFFACTTCCRSCWSAWCSCTSRRCTSSGSNNPLGIDVKSPQDTLPFHPYYTVKDSVGICVFCIVFAVLVFFAPNFLGDAEQLHPGQSAADAGRHRARVVLPAVLRDPALGAEQAARRVHDVRLDPGAVRAAVAGHLAGCAAPGSGRSTASSSGCWVLAFVVLGVCGAHKPEGIWVVLSRVATLYYFLHFLVILPILGKLERPLPLPESISRPVIGGGGPMPSGATAKPMEKA